MNTAVRDTPRPFRSRLRSAASCRRGLLVLVVLAGGAGLALNWGWLTAIGIAPVLLALAPCAAMCAAGMCMLKMRGKSCSVAAPQALNRNHGPTTIERS